MAFQDTLYGVIRLLTCGIWVGAAMFKLSHFQGFVDKLAEFNQPLPRAMAAGVVVIELGGSLFMLANLYVWAVCIAWIAFILYATYVEHRRVTTPDGEIDFHQYVQVCKNISLIGGLLALMMLDPAKPEWLMTLLGS